MENFDSHEGEGRLTATAARGWRSEEAALFGGAAPSEGKLAASSRGGEPPLRRPALLPPLLLTPLLLMLRVQR